MNSYSDELRLLWTVLLNGGVFAAAWQFARRRGSGGAVQAICDAFLLYFLTQYAAVALPGIFGIFNASTMSVVAMLAAGALWSGARNARALPDVGVTPPQTTSSRALVESCESRAGVDPGHSAPVINYRGTQNAGWKPVPLNDHLGLLACALFAAGYLASYAWSQRLIPPIATDAIVYHLPTAVQWLQTHRLGIYPSWYWNPAASYSPGTGSIFMAWWMAPAGNDLYVRFVQLPPLLWIFFLVVRMCRLMGCSRTVGGLIAVGATLCRPLFSEAIFPKDDLYVTAFVAAAVLSLAREPMRDQLSAWRVGIALGLALASKYTVLLACPIFLFMIDSPFRARWTRRQWMVAIALVAVLALPWYLRNIILTGNPLYPVDIHLPGLNLPGLFTTERDQQLRTAGGVWHMLADTYHSLPTALIVLLLVGWACACALGGRANLREPLPRACVIGSIGTLILFLITSPHHEVRYIFPLIVLMFAATGMALGRMELLGSVPHLVSSSAPPAPSPPGTEERGPEIAAAPRLSGVQMISFAFAIGIAIVSTLTSFSTSLIASTAGFAGSAAAIAAIVVGLVILQTRVLRLKRDRITLILGCATLVFGLLVYVFWHAYVTAYRQSRMEAWEYPTGYPRQADAWKWVDENVPADGTVAYANTFFVYPYYGFDFTRHVGYAPVRKGLHDFLHFPRMGERVPGDLLVRRMTEVMNENPDRETWIENLRAMNAGYLVVMKHDPDNPDLSADPPELKFAREDSAMFVPVAETEGGVVFRIHMK